jgi:Cullin family
LFRHVVDKDALMAIYVRHLAGRLVYGTTKSLALEHQLERAFADECGPDFTHKINTMLQDYDDSGPEKAREGPFRALVCSATAWPFDNRLSWVMPYFPATRLLLKYAFLD